MLPHIFGPGGFRFPRLFGRSLVIAALAIAVGASTARAESSPQSLFQAYDQLPDGTPEQLSEFYYSALAVPGIDALVPADKERLLDVVTHRYKNRLVDRGATSLERMRGHIARLSESKIAEDFPAVVLQTCAQYGLSDGPCAPHRGYVRRAQLLEEMLVAQRLTLDELEVELIGATRPGLRD